MVKIAAIGINKYMLIFFRALLPYSAGDKEITG